MVTQYVIGPSREPNFPSSGNEIIHLEADQRVYPCRCGQTHRGDYGHYDWAHHNCFHNEPLVEIDADEVPGYLMCPSCGKTFWLDRLVTEKSPDV